MATPLEMTILVKMRYPRMPTVGFEGELEATMIQLVRSYEDQQRAREDLELLTELNTDTGTFYKLTTIGHIE